MGQKIYKLVSCYLLFTTKATTSVVLGAWIHPQHFLSEFGKYWKYAKFLLGVIRKMFIDNKKDDYRRTIRLYKNYDKSARTRRSINPNSFVEKCVCLKMSFLDIQPLFV